jgi:hypothetical protein
VRAIIRKLGPGLAAPMASATTMPEKASNSFTVYSGGESEP